MSRLRTVGTGVATPAAISLAMAMVAVPAVAQQVPLPNLSVPSGTTEQELRRQPAPVAPQPQVKVVSGNALKAQQCPQSLLDSPVNVSLGGIDFTGPNGAPLSPEVRHAVAGVGRDTLGRSQPIRIVCDVRDAATAALTHAGYVAVVRVPEQTMENGKLRLEIVTAHIGSLHVRGDAGPLRSKISAMLQKLTEMKPFNKFEAERILLTVGDIPGITVSLELSPSPDGVIGEVVGDISVERTPGTLLFNVQNFGSEAIGRFGGQVRGELYGLTGLADRTALSVFTTSDFSEQQVVELSHDFAIGRSGLRFGADVTYAWTKPTLQFNSPNTTFDLKSRALLTSFHLSYPIRRGLGGNLLASGGFQSVDQWVKGNGSPLNRDALRIGYARLDADAQERSGGLAPAWRVSGDLELRKGFGIFGASVQGQPKGGAFPTRFEGDPKAFVVRGDLTTEVRALFGPGKEYAATFAATARGQWSNHPLLAFEEMAVGNLTIGRGYDPGATSGDRALGGSFELRLGKPLVRSRTDISYEGFVFYDAVRIWNLDSNTLENNRQLASWGGGVRMSWGDHGRLEVTYAKPLDLAQAQDQKKPPNRLLVSLIVRALPWHN